MIRALRRLIANLIAAKPVPVRAPLYQIVPENGGKPRFLKIWDFPVISRNGGFLRFLAHVLARARIVPFWRRIC